VWTPVKIPDAAGEGASQVNRRISNQELRMSKSASGDPRLSFAVLRFGVLRFCCSGERRRRRRSLSDRLKKRHFKTALTPAEPAAEAAGELPAEAGTLTEAPAEPLAWPRLKPRENFRLKPGL
jgi:hypothetical protein